MSPNAPLDSSVVATNTTNNNNNNNNNNNTNHLHALQLHEFHTAQRIQQLESIISNNTLGVVSRTKAKVELALLKKKQDENFHNQYEDEIAAVKSGAGVTKTKRMIEKDEEDRLAHELDMQAHLAQLYRIAMAQRDEARSRLNEQRLNSAAADEALRLAEKEAQDAMALVKLAMDKLNEARKVAGKERRLYEEARLVVDGHVAEIDRLKKNSKVMVGKKSGGESYSSNDGDSEDWMEGVEQIDDLKETEEVLSMQLAAEEEVASRLSAVYCAELDNMNANLSTMQHEAEDAKYWSLKCSELTKEVTRLNTTVSDTQAINQHQASKIASLEAHIQSSDAYWMDQSTKLSSDLQNVLQQKDEQEDMLEKLKKKIATEDNQMRALRADIEDLQQMKIKLEQSVAQEKIAANEDGKLDALTHEIMQLISDKEDALHSVEVVKEEYEGKVSEKEAKINELQRDVELYIDDIQQTQDTLSAKVEGLHSSIVSYQAKKVQEEEYLIEDQGRVVRELESEVKRYAKEVEVLEEENAAQRSKIKKIKQIVKTDGLNEDLFLMQDKEILRLKALLGEQVEKTDKLSFDVKHWKSSANDLSKSMCGLKEERDKLKHQADELRTHLYFLKEQRANTMALLDVHLPKEAKPVKSLETSVPDKKMKARDVPKEKDKKTSVSKAA